MNKFARKIVKESIKKDLAIAYISYWHVIHCLYCQKNMTIVLLQVAFILILCFLCRTSVTCGNKSIFIYLVSWQSVQRGALELQLTCELAHCTLLLYLGFWDRKEWAPNPECLFTMSRVNVEFLASLRHHNNRNMRQQSISPSRLLDATSTQPCSTAQELNSSSPRSTISFSASELGLAHVGLPPVTTAGFRRSQFLRYWILQSQWKRFPESETVLRLASLSNAPGDTAVSWLSCRWSSVVSDGSWGTCTRSMALQLTRRSPAGQRVEQRQGPGTECALEVAKSRNTPSPECILQTRRRRQVTFTPLCESQKHITQLYILR